MKRLKSCSFFSDVTLLQETYWTSFTLRMGRQHQKQWAMPNCKACVCKSFSLRTGVDLSKTYCTVIYVFNLLLRVSSSLVGGRRNLRYCFSQESRNKMESIHTRGKCDLRMWLEISGSSQETSHRSPRILYVEQIYTNCIVLYSNERNNINWISEMTWKEQSQFIVR